MELQKEQKQSVNGADSLQNVTKRRAVAEKLVAEDMLSDEKIAEACGVSRMTLARWKKQPKFAANVERIKAEYKERFLKRGLARQEVRLAELDDLYERYRTILRERGEWDEMKGIPGGSTGLICKTYKGLGSNVQPVYEVDNPTAKAMQEIHDRYADELGQKIFRSKTDVTVSGSISARMAAAEETMKKEAQRAAESKTA